jgi:hypothetical protein
VWSWEDFHAGLAVHFRIHPFFQKGRGNSFGVFVRIGHMTEFNFDFPLIAFGGCGRGRNQQRYACAGCQKSSTHSFISVMIVSVLIVSDFKEQQNPRDCQPWNWCGYLEI